MNWDAQSDRAAIRYYSDWCPDGIQEAHRRGARRQRQALLSDDAVERAARVATPRLYWDYADWGEASECGREEARIIARKVLTAAIGDDDE